MATLSKCFDPCDAERQPEAIDELFLNDVVRSAKSFISHILITRVCVHPLHLLPHVAAHVRVSEDFFSVLKLGGEARSKKQMFNCIVVEKSAKEVDC